MCAALPQVVLQVRDEDLLGSLQVLSGLPLHSLTTLLVGVHWNTQSCYITAWIFLCVSISICLSLSLSLFLSLSLSISLLGSTGTHSPGSQSGPLSVSLSHYLSLSISLYLYLLVGVH